MADSESLPMIFSQPYMMEDTFDWSNHDPELVTDQSYTAMKAALMSPKECKTLYYGLLVVGRILRCRASHALAGLVMAPMFASSLVAVGNEDSQAGPVLYVWIYFNLVVNTILLPLLVATFVFSRAKRHPTLVNLCITWIFSGVFAILLFYANQLTRPEPSGPLCVAQAALLFGITPMWSVAVFMLFYFMAMAVRCDTTRPLGSWKLLLMLTSPYIAQFSFSLAALVLSLEHPDKVTRELRLLYCALDHPKLSLANSLFTLLICVGIVILEVHLGIVAYRNYCGLRKAGKCRHGIDFAFYLRVLIFGAYIAFGMIVNIVSVARPSSVVPDIYAATAGAGVFLVFGTQRDVLNVWCVWRRRSSEEKGSGAIQVAFPSRTESPTPFESSDLEKKFPISVEDIPPPPPPKPRDYRISRGILIPTSTEIRGPTPVYGYKSAPSPV